MFKLSVLSTDQKDMPYLSSSRGTRGRTAGTRRRGFKRRRRTSVATQAKYRKGANAQSWQIRKLARLAVSNARVLRGQRLYTDYVLVGSSDATWTATTWYVQSLMDPISWKPTLRQNGEADNSQNAYVRNMFFQYTCALNTLKNGATVTLLLVSIRSNAAGFEPSSANMTNAEEFQNMGSYQMPILNSGLMRVIWAKTFVVQSNGLGGASIAQSSTTAVGDPETTYSRGSANISIRDTLRSPSRFIAPNTAPQSWTTLNDKDLRPNQRLYLMAYYQSQDGTNAAGLNWSCKFTAITSN